MATRIQKLEDKLWEACDKLRANSELSSNEYSTPVLGLIFLKYADFKFESLVKKLGKDVPDKIDVQAEGVIYLPEAARYSSILSLPEGAEIGKAINTAMKAIEGENEDLRGVLPKDYTRINSPILIDLLKHFNSISFEEGDTLGKIYEYFLGQFALAEGRGGGEFFTPISLVKLIVEILEPFQGRIFDPACGSGGMFVQSAGFVEAHHKSASANISIYGQEKTAATVRLAKMNLAVHGISGDIRQGNSYYEDIHESLGKFDYVMANPPFNVKGIDKDRIKNDPRFKLGILNVDNGNYLWIQLFYAALSKQGRAGFVMANSASDARDTALQIRKKLIEDKAVDVMVAVGPNMFYTVTLPCQLWFLDKRKRETERENKVLFIDARNIFRQVDRAHREFTSAQIEFLANIVNLYRGEEPEFQHGSEQLFKDKGMAIEKYQNCAGLCRVATYEDIKRADWSLNPGRYVGMKEAETENTDFMADFEELNGALVILNTEAHRLEDTIEANTRKVLDGLSK